MATLTTSTRHDVNVAGDGEAVEGGRGARLRICAHRLGIEVFTDAELRQFNLLSNAVQRVTGWTPYFRGVQLAVTFVKGDYIRFKVVEYDVVE